ncbi:TM0106 family RecB-like putative nuclease [Nocardioides coralli]|uniref:TM0106 family RecB-like putative nuclease n=1 Tax=Nocardioides coralli TaxID=2872154 RepID=UPI001CA3976E|nr:bifunctional RecB family nuclease/DEAD/DEAH box helicase [Nocardioides coralli]QZY29689.1 TM0106 family RecB-like putative nuclease [Nocardioides coralli]
MQLLGSRLLWSATDLTAAASCEYGLLSEVDRRLGRVAVAQQAEDPLIEQIAELGIRHEKRELERLRELHGPYDAVTGSGVREFQLPRGGDATVLDGAAELTAGALKSGADVLYQPAFFDESFFGLADFVRRSDAGWVVCDAKLARHAKAAALLQLAAYADQLAALGASVAPTVELLLGNGVRETFRRSDIEPVFRERRARLVPLLNEHAAQDQPVGWPAPELLVCGSCVDCQAAAKKADDLILVAGMRMEQRRKLNAAGTYTLQDLAARETAPEGMAATTFQRLRAQAEMQILQEETPVGEVPSVHFRVFDEEALLAMPAKSPGDLFFDFEGDPLHNEGDPSDWGLEYLWGVLTSPAHPTQQREFLPLWADSHAEERAQLIAFLDDVAVRLTEHPDLHIYHYAPYEVSALKRLTAKHKTHEAILDELLRNNVFVDLYAVVRASIRISQRSYSIKMLEPLYIENPRTGDVTKGDVSIAEYHAYRLFLEQGKSEDAMKSRGALLDYNRYDCESTLELRDWLYALVERSSSPSSVPAASESGEKDEEHDELAMSLLSRSGSAERIERSPEEQAWAMFASALGYHRRERLPSAWEHFHRLFNPVAEWESSSDVLVFSDSPAIVQDWEKLPGKQTYSRVLECIAHVGPGNRVSRGELSALYAAPYPSCSEPHDGARHAIGCGATITELTHVNDEQVKVRFEERLKRGQTGFPQTPLALVPGYGVNDKPLEAAVREVAEGADQLGILPQSAIADVLRRRPPRLRSLAALPRTGDVRRDIVAALRDLDSSYLAIQGPPGTGKTYTGSHVIRELVERHGWKVGVVAQSHDVVENFLASVVGSGLDAQLIGKKATKTPAAPWQTVGDPAAFVANHPEGCVVGGTAWNFSASSFERACLDLLVIDEAGQFSLANTMAVSVAARRLLLLGDPQQLPQVSQGTHGEPVNESALGWLMGEDAALPPELGYFLDRSFRMHPAVCELVSTLSYDGELKATEVPAARTLHGVHPGVLVVRVPHVGNSVASAEEAEEIVARIQALMGTPWTDPQALPVTRPLDQRDFLVVAPYNAQRQLISRKMKAAGLNEVQVGTVDKFQGKQAPVVLTSMTASSQAEVPRGIGFLLNRNRVNVAVSRAQWLAILVRSETLTAYMPATVPGLLELGAFAGLCEASLTGA